MTPLAWGAGAIPPLVAADPLLDHTLGYFQAYLNAHAVEGWHDVTPGEYVVATVHSHRPEKGAFSDSLLPALFMWRSRIDPAEQTTQSWRTRTSQLQLLWILPVASQELMAARGVFMPSVLSVLERAIERLRDPSWVVAGDPDPRAATDGSYWPRWAGWMAFALEAATPIDVTIDLESGDSRTYDAIAGSCAVTEILTPPATAPPTPPAPPNDPVIVVSPPTTP